MKKRIIIFLSLFTLNVVITCGFLSCNAQPKVFDSMVRIGKSPFDTHEPVVVSLGQVLGDSSQVVTILNYEDADWGKYSLDDLWVNRQRDTVQAIDSRTGATLLSISEIGLQGAQTGDVSKLKPGQTVMIQELAGIGGFIVTASATIISADISSPFIEVKISKEPTQVYEEWVAMQGAAVTDKQGRLLGLVGANYNRLISGQTANDAVIRVVKIDSILDLLSPNASQQPWAAGPAVSALATNNGITGYTSGILTSISNYNKMTAAVQELVVHCDKPLAGSELPHDYPAFFSGFPENADGTLLTLVYPSSIDLRNSEGKIEVSVSGWIGLQWGRSDGKPNRLFYGFTPYLVAGGFEVNGDFTALNAAVKE